MKDAIASFPDRVKAIRKATGLTQEDFLATLRTASTAVLGEGVRKYSQSTLSRLESGRQTPTLEDVAVLAACDPEHRSKLWLGWDEEAVREPRVIPEGGLMAGRITTVPSTPHGGKKRR
jgi:transcriptional regulator with XRE-family HTH domain